MLAIGAAMVFARRVSGRVEALGVAAAKVGAGDLAVKVEANGSDELGTLGRAFNQMTAELVRSRAALVDRERLQKELQIAQQIQTALLPSSLEAPGYRIEAAMLPAEEVGGDLYDVLHGRDGHTWLCIGDVTSHGLTPGLIMMMVQSAVSALVSQNPAAHPKEVLVHLNRVIYANVQERVRDDNYLTLTVLRSDGPGRFLYAGAHLDLLVRRKNGQVERKPTPGMWVGIVPELENVEESSVELEPGDALILYTDGLTEVRNAKGEQLDLAGVTPIIERTAGARELKDALMDAARTHLVEQDDDITVMVVERVA
jgi:sigma-B regulation protein RsbU (phosphoserine phosphatase)